MGAEACRVHRRCGLGGLGRDAGSIGGVEGIAADGTRGEPLGVLERRDSGHGHLCVTHLDSPCRGSDSPRIDLKSVLGDGVVLGDGETGKLSIESLCRKDWRSRKKSLVTALRSRVQDSKL